MEQEEDCVGQSVLSAAPDGPEMNRPAKASIAQKATPGWPGGSSELLGGVSKARTCVYVRAERYGPVSVSHWNTEG